MRPYLLLIAGISLAAGAALTFTSQASNPETQQAAQGAAAVEVALTLPQPGELTRPPQALRTATAPLPIESAPIKPVEAQPANQPQIETPAEEITVLPAARVTLAKAEPLPVQEPAQQPLDNLPVSAPDPVATAAEPTAPAQPVWREVQVRSGDSLALIFDRLGLSARELHNIIHSSKKAKELERIHPGDTLRVRMEDDRLAELVHEKDRLNALRITRNDEGYDATAITREPEKRIASTAGAIKSSLFLAAGQAGLNDNLTMELAGIFGWDIDFALDIRENDQFAVLYEELWLDGERIGNGDIIAAEFVNRGETFRALRYTDASGRTDYYSPDGRSMRKAFLRTPVEFSRISSRFNLKRKHPVLNRIRAHRGVDYAAPTGTPIRATGDGKIVHRGTKGGYGKTVILQHGSSRTTLYAHLSRYASGQQTGSRVKQGQVIGYIGSSGLATGPHLHYEFRVDGVHRNPLTVRLPDASPIASKYKPDFEKAAQPLLAELELVRSTRLAMQDN